MVALHGKWVWYKYLPTLQNFLSNWQCQRSTTVLSPVHNDARNVVLLFEKARRRHREQTKKITNKNENKQNLLFVISSKVFPFFFPRVPILQLFYKVGIFFFHLFSTLLEFVFIWRHAKMPRKPSKTLDFFSHLQGLQGSDFLPLSLSPRSPYFLFAKLPLKA